MVNDILFEKYNISFGKISDWYDQQDKACPKVIITDENVFSAQQSAFNDVFQGVPHLVLPAGEQAKSLDALARVYDFFAEQKLNRAATVMAVGGGVIGDLTGFAAATYLRGINCIQIPTSLLAMVDSSIGGKTGINSAFGKNLIGTFTLPEAIFVDNHFLKTLPKREFKAGIAEIIKYALLGEKSLLQLLESNVFNQNIEEVIKLSILKKLTFVEEDFRDIKQSSGRVFLNLGHTFAHAIEAEAKYKDILHGEAVAIGLLMAAKFSEKLGFLDSSVCAQIKQILIEYELPTHLPFPVSSTDLVNRMNWDKKRAAEGIRLVLLKGIGQPFLYNNIDSNMLIDLCKEFGAV